MKMKNNYVISLAVLSIMLIITAKNGFCQMNQNSYDIDSITIYNQGDLKLGCLIDSIEKSRELFKENININFAEMGFSENNYTLHKVIIKYKDEIIFQKDSTIAASKFIVDIVGSDTVVYFNLFHFVNDLSSLSNLYLVNLSKGDYKILHNNCINSCNPFYYGNQIWFIDNLKLKGYNLSLKKITTILNIYTDSFFNKDYEYLDTYIFDEILFYNENLILKFSSNGFHRETKNFIGSFSIDKVIVIKDPFASPSL